jgi:hypothetical protein
MKRVLCRWAAVGLIGLSASSALADREVHLLEVPDYSWYAACFATACGNLMGYWDRHGLSDFYTGPTAGGVAPLSSSGANSGIRALSTSKAGLDGRPSIRPGHIDDYYVDYDRTDPDPYIAAHRAEHNADCIGDFIGLNQQRWTNMNNECDGNIDGYSFVYWEKKGTRRINFTPVAPDGTPALDMQSGLRAWTRYRGYEADTFTQLTDFNPTVAVGQGFSFQNLKAEIDAGYPVLLFLQNFSTYSKARGAMLRANPDIHGMLAYGYAEYPDMGIRWVYYRTSWASGDGTHHQWDNGVWEAGMPVRGVIGFRPHPKLRSVSRQGDDLTLAWDGPASQLYDDLGYTTTLVHRYQVETSPGVSSETWTPVGDPTTDRTLTVSNCCAATSFYRVRLLGP